MQPLRARKGCWLPRGLRRPRAQVLWTGSESSTLRGMKEVLRLAICAAVLAAGCRRPAPEDSWSWEKNPGLDPRPTGQTLGERWGEPLADTTFRWNPSRRTEAEPSEVKPATEEEEMYALEARSGKAWAQTRLGTKYAMQSEDLARMGEGLRLLRAAAEQDDTEALRVLSALAASGRGMDQSDLEAYKYMRRAAELGSPEAQYNLAGMLAGGKGLPRDREAALVWGRKAAEQGYAPAQVAMGRLLIGSVEQERKREALDFLEKAAAQGNTEALLFLSSAVGKGDFGLPKDEARAEALLLPAAEQGNADCQFVLAALYQHGETFADRRGEVRVWLQRAADQGHAKAREVLRSESEKR
jgi:TPR repeat protein